MAITGQEGNFWKKKRVLVTGYEGFLGSNLVKKLIMLGSEVYGLDIVTRRKNTVLSGDFNKINIFKGSVEDFNLASRIMAGNKIGIVFHLAATSLVGEALEDPLRAFNTNIEGTWNILEACRRVPGIKAVIIASSDKAYGEHSNLPYKEDYSLIGNHPYDVSKSCADLLAYTYYNTYKLPVVVTRCGNIYGPGDFNFSRLIPDAMRCILSGKTLEIRSDGNFIRDYVYVDDIVTGYIKIAELLKKRGLSGEAFNLSDEKPISVIKLLDEINSINFRGKKLKYKIMNTAKYEIKKQYLSSVKARRILGWRPRYSLKEGLRETVNWYADYFSK